MIGCPLAVAVLSSCRLEPDRWIVPHFAVWTYFDCRRWTCKGTQPVQRTPLGPAFWLPAVDKGRNLPMFRGSGRSMVIDCSL